MHGWCVGRTFDGIVHKSTIGFPPIVFFLWFGHLLAWPIQFTLILACAVVVRIELPGIDGKTDAFHSPIFTVLAIFTN
jgi:hypothetical protein